MLRLEYRPIAKKLYHWILWGSVLTELVILRFKLPELQSETWYNSVLILFLASTVPLTLIVRCFFFLRPRIFSIYEVSETEIIKNIGKKKEVYRFSDIENIKISKFSPRFFGGFSIRFKTGQSLVFLSLLKGNEKILKRIPSTHLSEEDIRRYSQVSQLVDISWERIFEKFQSWKWLLLKYFGPPVAMSLIFLKEWSEFLGTGSHLETLLFSLLIVFLGNLLFAMFLNHFEESWVLKKTIENEGKRDTAFEKRVTLGIHFVFLMIWLLLALSRLPA